VTLSIPAYIKKYSDLEPGQHLDEVVQVAGRIHNIRSGSAKLKFYDLHGEGVKIQIMAQAQ
jgi:lysyl-tRNA synthetase class 2